MTKQVGGCITHTGCHQLSRQNMYSISIHQAFGDHLMFAHLNFFQYIFARSVLIRETTKGFLYMLKFLHI